MTPLEKLDARAANERLKLTANLLNTLAAGTFVGGVVAPLIAGRQVDPIWTALLAPVGLLLHLFGRLMFYDLKPEQ